MLRPKEQTNLKNARDYFREHLCVGDYYAAGQTISGEWIGAGAEMLGLAGQVREKEFLELCGGMDPRSGDRLTQRMNSTRREGDSIEPNRRIFYDFTISPPKSVSVVALYQDARIVEVHNRAVRTAMAELESLAQTRVRRSGQNDERVTGNIVAACFRHDTSRELDPHLHTHCVVFNATFDSAENRWKALETVEMYRARKFGENLYYHELAKGLRSLGYEIENNLRDFEIKGVPVSVIDRFSKRHRQIDDETNRLIAREGEKGNVAELRELIAHSKRRRKQGNSTAERLRPDWKAQMPAEEIRALEILRYRAAGGSVAVDLPGIVTWADSHLFERRAVVNNCELLSAALARGRGCDFNLGGLRAEIDRRGYFWDNDGRQLTSPEVLRHEVAVVMAAYDRRYEFGPFNPDFQPSPDLSEEQRIAVEEILKSRGMVTLFRGAAGTGKSFTLREVVRGLKDNGFPTVVLTPQRQQAGDLSADGMPATTLARFLEAKEVLRHTVVLLDEAGQVGARQMHELIATVDARGGRLILSGDTRQHGAVEASDILRAIEKHAGIKSAVLRQIRRQNPALAKDAAERAFIRSYRYAVKAASAGRIDESFDRLDQIGCVREVGDADRLAALTKEYIESTARGDQTLVVAQTWDEVHRSNDAIRTALRAKGQVESGTVLKALEAVDLTEAQKRDPRFIPAGSFACFQRRYGRFNRGDCCAVVEANERGFVLLKNGRRSTMSSDYVGRVTLATEREMEIGVGDRLQLKFNAKSREGLKIANGELVTVRQLTADGAMVVEDRAGVKKTLEPSQRHFVRGYAVTSYASQGKTVDTVLIADSGCRAATNANQWYVAISRGKKRVAVFTGNKEQLRANVTRSGDRDLALDLQTAEPGKPVRRVRSARVQRMLAYGERHRRYHRFMEIVVRQTQHIGIHL